MVISKNECADIAKILSAAPNSSVLPILQKARIGADGDNGIFFQAGNLEYLATYIVGSGVLPDLFIDAKHLARALKSPIGDEKTLSSEFNRLVVSTDVAKVKLNSGHELNDYPVYDIGLQEHVLTVPAAEFQEKIASALVFVSNDEIRPAMTYIPLQGDGERCTVVATDGHRLYFDDVCVL